MDGGGTDTACPEKVSHEIRMADGDAKTECPCPAVLSPLAERSLGSFLCLHCLREPLEIEAPVSPRNRLEVHRIRNAPIVERDELTPANAVDQSALIDEVVTAQGKQVSPVHPLGCRRETEQKAGGEVIDDLAIRGRRGVVELSSRTHRPRTD